MCRARGPRLGVAIPPEVHEMYPEEVKKAWEDFDAWLADATDTSSDGRASKSTMPENIRVAMELILSTQIPGQPEGVTGEQSCYMIGVQSYRLKD